MISREQATSIAAEAAKALGLGTAVDKVLDPPEIDRLRVYGHDFESCWVAYVTQTDWQTLQASTIVAVDKWTGQVVYAGSAYDEG